MGKDHPWGVREEAMKTKILHVVGARPNFMKAAPLIKECGKSTSFDSYLVHTGQHYDARMSDVFFRDLSIPEPDVFLNVGSASHAVQCARIMMKFEKVLLRERPELILVYGDVNSTLACTLVAVKMGIKVAHVEAGLRSGDKEMPEEINRIVVDSLADYLFTPSPDASENLMAEGIKKNKIHFVGNIMIDTLAANLPQARRSTVLDRLRLQKKRFVLVTLHRPANVDSAGTFSGILEAIAKISRDLIVVFPVHPRTRKNLGKDFKKSVFDRKNVLLTPPLGYHDFLKLMLECYCVLTDSGGIQEETTFLNIPCLTIRSNTERPITVEKGTNVLTGMRPESILRAFYALGRRRHHAAALKYWDGHCAQRIVRILKKSLNRCPAKP